MLTRVNGLLTGQFIRQVAFLPSDPVPERVRRECRAECDVCTPGSPTRAVGQQAPFMTSSRLALDEAGWVKRQVWSCAQHVYFFVDILICADSGKKFGAVDCACTTSTISVLQADLGRILVAVNVVRLQNHRLVEAPLAM